MSDVLVWIPGVFPDTRPPRPIQVSAVINLHRSKLPPIPNEGERERSEGVQEEERKERRKQRTKEKKGGNSGGAGRRKELRIDEDNDGT